MKLSAREAARFASAPDLKLAGALIYGEDAVEVAARRARIVKAAIGDGGEMSLRRIAAAEARRDPASVLDAMKVQGFFGGRPVVVVEEAGDGLAGTLAAALEAAGPEDGYLIVTAGILPARSKLRKAFEGARNAAAAPVYADAPDGAAVREMLAEAGLERVEDDALRDLEAMARDLDPYALRDLVARLALYALDPPEAITAVDIAACAPPASDADLDATLDAVADGRAEALGPLIARLAAQGQSPTGVAIAACRYFRRIHSVAASVAGGVSVDAAVGGLRPPVFGPRRDALIRRCRKWPLGAAESALGLLLETDDALRGGAGAAGHAVLERAFLKLALTARRF